MRVHCSGRHAGRVEGFDPLGPAASTEHGVHLFDQSVEVRHSIGVRRETRIAAPLWMPKYFGNALPVRLVGAADVDPAVLRVECLVRRRHDVRRTSRAGRFAGREIDRRVPIGLLDGGLHQRRVDHLAAACLQFVDVSREDADDREVAGADVGDRVAVLRRRAARFAGDGHQPSETLRDEIEASLVGPRSVAAESGHRAVNQAGIHAATACRSRAPFSPSCLCGSSPAAHRRRAPFSAGSPCRAGASGSARCPACYGSSSGRAPRRR